MFPFYLLSIFVFDVFACEPNEIHIREQIISSYTKDDGTRVSAHLRSEHCRLLKEVQFFQNIPRDESKKIKTQFKNWRKEDQKIVQDILNGLPNWLKQYQLGELLRADTLEANHKNPALTIPRSKTLVIFDSFFKENNKREIIIHEMAHIAVWDFSEIELKEFLLLNGWSFSANKPPQPPKQLIKADSQNSPSEDFANCIEIYYSNPEQLKKFNLKSYLKLESLIMNKEKK